MSKSAGGLKVRTRSSRDPSATRRRCRLQWTSRLRQLSQNPPHVFCRQLGVLVDKLQSHRLTVLYRQRMAQLKAGITLVSNVQQAEHFRQALLVALQRNSV